MCEIGWKWIELNLEVGEWIRELIPKWSCVGLSKCWFYFRRGWGWWPNTGEQKSIISISRSRGCENFDFFQFSLSRQAHHNFTSYRRFPSPTTTRRSSPSVKWSFQPYVTQCFTNGTQQTQVAKMTWLES